MREGSWDVGRREPEWLRHEWVRETMVEYGEFLGSRERKVAVTECTWEAQSTHATPSPPFIPEPEAWVPFWYSHTGPETERKP